jgi:DNA-binding CsgD family transcriptional regulator
MSNSVSVSDRDLRVLAAIVSEDRTDLPAEEGLPPSLLADLMEQIRCDSVSFYGLDSGRQNFWFYQGGPDGDDGPDPIFEQTIDQALWQHYWDCLPCSYPDASADLRSVITIADFYSARQWLSTAMYADVYRPQEIRHSLMLSLPGPPGPSRGPDRTARLFFTRADGLDFSERDRALLVLLRPHLHQAYLDAQRRRDPVPRLTPRQTDLLRHVADGHTNAQIARRLGLSEGTVRTHLENIYERLGVSSRTAAVLRAFPDRVV